MASSLTLPTLLQKAFADAGAKNVLPITPSPTPGLASYEEGFPPETMQPISTGGIPPSGEDMNGVLFDISAVALWLNAGGVMPYDSALSTAISGYPLGAVVTSVNHGMVQSLVDGNTNDPDSSMTGWTHYAGAQVSLAQWGLPATGTANAIVIAPVADLGAFTNGQVLTFLSSYSNTGAVTINDGRGVVDLKNNVGQALAAGDIVAGTVYAIIAYNSGYRLIGAAASQSTNSISGTGNGAGTSGSSALMQGAAVQLTAKTSGKFRITYSGRFYPSATATEQSIMYLGTGTPPSPGDAAGPYAAYALAPPQTITSDVTSTFPPFFVVTTMVTGLTLGTTYWADLSYMNTSAGTAGLGYTTIEIEEVP